MAAARRGRVGAASGPRRGRVGTASEDRILQGIPREMRISRIYSASGNERTNERASESLLLN